MDTSSLKTLLEDLEETLQQEIVLLDKLGKIRHDQLLEVASLEQMRKSLDNITQEELEVVAVRVVNQLRVVEEMTAEVNEIKNLLGMGVV